MKYFLLFLSVMAFFVACNRAPQGDLHDGNSTTAASVNQLTSEDQLAWRSKVPSIMERLTQKRDSGLTSIRKASDQRTADSLLSAFRSTYSHAISVVSDSLYAVDPFQIWLQSTLGAADSLAPLLNPYGCSLLLSEGIPSLELNSGFLLAQCGERLSPGMQKFLSIREREEHQGFSDDAALLISWNALSDRIAEWEAFLSQTHGLSVLPEARGWYELYLRVYLTGLDNARVFNPDNDSLATEVHASYQRYVSQYSDTKSGRIVAGYLNVLERHSWKNSKEAEAYLTRSGITTTLAMQAPLR